MSESVESCTAEVLAAHGWQGNPTLCRCGWDTPALHVPTGVSHAAHVASVLAAEGLLAGPDLHDVVETGIRYKRERNAARAELGQVKADAQDAIRHQIKAEAALAAMTKERDELVSQVDTWAHAAGDYESDSNFYKREYAALRAAVEAVCTQVEADNEEALNRTGQHLYGAVVRVAEMVREALLTDGSEDRG